MKKWKVFERGTPEWDNGMGPMRIYFGVGVVLAIMVMVTIFQMVR